MKYKVKGSSVTLELSAEERGPGGLPPGQKGGICVNFL
jgi:hypothetical protein